MGATGVSVNGKLYDVTFGDDIYANGITTFTNLTDATAASQALKDTVFNGANLYLLEDGSVNGCATTARRCEILTPYANAAGARGISTSFSRYNGVITNGTQARAGTTYSDGEYVTLAKWTVSAPAVSAVPVPAAAWLFGSGLLGLVGLRRRQQQA